MVMLGVLTPAALAVMVMFTPPFGLEPALAASHPLAARPLEFMSETRALAAALVELKTTKVCVIRPCECHGVIRVIIW